eukprot:3333873-Lingulodinium_polyedra.AAC.1
MWGVSIAIAISTRHAIECASARCSDGLVGRIARARAVKLLRRACVSRACDMNPGGAKANTP